jgi:putative transposase
MPSFGSIEDARAFCATFFTWYNTQHRHSGIGLLAPADVHAGRAPEITAARSVTLDAAYAAHPERFVRRPPTPPEVPTAVWVNPPARQEVPTQ